MHMISKDFVFPNDFINFNLFTHQILQKCWKPIRTPFTHIERVIQSLCAFGNRTNTLHNNHVEPLELKEKKHYSRACLNDSGSLCVEPPLSEKYHIQIQVQAIEVLVCVFVRQVLIINFLLMLPDSRVDMQHMVQKVRCVWMSISWDPLSRHKGVEEGDHHLMHILEMLSISSIFRNFLNVGINVV